MHNRMHSSRPCPRDRRVALPPRAHPPRPPRARPGEHGDERWRGLIPCGATARGVVHAEGVKVGWELRHGGRRYLYRNHRVNGKPVKEYHAADDQFGLGELMAENLRRLQSCQTETRRLMRQRKAEYRARIDGLLTDAVV